MSPGYTRCFVQTTNRQVYISFSSFLTMFKSYGILGVILIILVELNFILKIQPFALWYFPLIWLGYILTIDAMVYKLRRDSLLSNRPRQLLGMALISMLLWWVFEFINLNVQNWSYQGTSGMVKSNLMASLAFATVLPALFETTELFRTINLFKSAHLRHKYRITKRFVHSMMIAGLLCLIAPLILPAFAFPLVWLSFFLLLDPLNYLHSQPSIIGHLKDRKLAIPLTLITAGLLLGFLWEFWNYWAIPKWTYHIPYVGFFKIFEMPILGYLGYLPFSFELYSMYWFVRGLFINKEHLLAD